MPAGDHGLLGEGDGRQPYFVIHQAVDPGLIQLIEQDILPRLQQAVPGQPSAEALAADPLRHRLTLVFDREGYSPDFMQRMKTQWVACLTYHKYPGDDGAKDRKCRLCCCMEA